MFRNPSFEKALALMVHPLSLAALGLLLVNDQVLRHLSPSWWTGKLSDLAWLFFVPFVASAFLAWLVPAKKNRRNHENWTFLLAYSIVGVGFILCKTIPAVNTLATRIFTGVTGAAPSLSVDPSDLLAVPALFFSAWLWRSSQSSRGRGPGLAQPGIERILRGLVILPVAALVLLADAAAPDPGIVCFSHQGDEIYARGGYDSSFVSKDGGVNWEPYQPISRIECEQKTALAAGEDGWLEAPGAQKGVRYRYMPGEEIQVSTDGGNTWKTGMKFTTLTEPERIYFLKSRGGTVVMDTGPFDAAADPGTGNMLFAMGQEGVLIHTAQGQWQWSKGGAYQRPENFPSADAVVLLLGGMVILAVGAALLIYATLALHWTKHWLRITVLILAWLAWLGVVVLFPPAASYSYSETISLMGIIALAVLILPLAIEQTIRLVKRSPRDIPRLLGYGLAGGLLFFLPYIFWVYNALPEILWATTFSLLLAAVILIAGWIRQRMQQTKNASPV